MFLDRGFREGGALLLEGERGDSYLISCNVIFLRQTLTEIPSRETGIMLIGCPRG